MHKKTKKKDHQNINEQTADDFYFTHRFLNVVLEILYFQLYASNMNF